MDHPNRKQHDKLYRERHKDQIREVQQQYYKKHREKILQKQKDNAIEIKQYNQQYCKDNKDKIKQRMKVWREEHREEINRYRRNYNKDYERNRLRIDPKFKLRKTVSHSINRGLKKRLASKQGKSTFDFLPYTVDELKQHIEKQFEPWMNWANWGSGKDHWQIDHIKPDAVFDYKTVVDKDFQNCWALSNLQPLDAIENIKKGASM